MTHVYRDGEIKKLDRPMMQDWNERVAAGLDPGLYVDDSVYEWLEETEFLLIAEESITVYQIAPAPYQILASEIDRLFPLQAIERKVMLALRGEFEPHPEYCFKSTVDW